jgi:hypothetical protein
MDYRRSQPGLPFCAVLLGGSVTVADIGKEREEVNR